GKRRIERHRPGQALQPHVVGHDERDAPEDPVPGHALADRGGEGERPLLPRAEQGRAEGLRLCRHLLSRGRGEYGPRVRECLTLAVDAPVGEQEARDEHEQDGCAGDRSAEGDRVRTLALLLAGLARAEGGGAHQSSIPSPIATASEPSWPPELMPCPEPTRANGSATRTLMPISSSSCSGSPCRWAPPPVMVISAKPRESG